jgi:hypothetical protein
MSEQTNPPEQRSREAGDQPEPAGRRTRRRVVTTEYESDVGGGRRQVRVEEETDAELDTGWPADAEVDDWAERERRRRESWVSGPSQAERWAWARHERQRRQASSRSAAAFEPDPTMEHLRRDATYVVEGAFALLTTFPLRIAADLVRAGREFQDSVYAPRRVRRVRYYEDD